MDESARMVPSGVTVGDEGTSNQPTIGEIVTPYIASRDMKMYAITEDEVNSISTASTLRSIFFSLAFAIAAFAASIWLPVQIAGGSDALPQMTAVVQVLYQFALPILVVVAVILGVCGALFWYSASRTIANLKTESKSQKATV